MEKDEEKRLNGENSKRHSNNNKNEQDGGFLQLPTKWRWLLVILIVLCVLLLVLVIVGFSASKPIHSKTTPIDKSTQTRGCKSLLNLPIDLDKTESIFHDLTEAELKSIRDYVLKQPSLDVMRYKNASLDRNFIYAIELFLPQKSEALQFLDNKGKRPLRKARVVIIHGGTSPKTVTEYIVGPLPKPNNHIKIGQKYRKSSVPFYARPFTWFEAEKAYPLMYNATKEAYPLLKESFNYWFHNCTDHCLVTLPIGQSGRKLSEKRYTWVQFSRNIKGMYLFNVPLQMLVDYTDPNNLRLLKVVYNNQMFDTVSQLMASYKSKTLKMMIMPEPSEQIKLRATMKRRGDPVPVKPAKGPALFEPHGRRFSVQGNTVSYMNWRFDFGIRPTAGPALFDVRFKGKRIAYEVSLQEGIAYYSGYDPETSNTHYLDSSWGLGSSNTPLIHGIDCPETALYLDSYVFLQSDEPIKNSRSICIFETNPQMPLWRHMDLEFNRKSTGVKGLWSMGGMMDHALTIRVISTPFNYDYVFDYVLHQNGAIEVKTSPSGYINPAVYTPQEADYGFLTMENMIGSVHDHFLLYKVDLDVAGQKNSYHTVDVVAENTRYEWETNANRIKKKVVKNTKKTEKDAVLRYDFDKPKYLVFTNEKANNTYGQPKGYRIDIKSKCKQLYSDDYLWNKAVSWTKYQLAVTKYSDRERYGSSIYNQYMTRDPAFDFDSIVDDNEVIENEDLVAWVSIGGLHIPNTEDIPMTSTVGNAYSFFIRPFGYFDEDPSFASTNAQLIDRGSDGKFTLYKYGTPDNFTCNTK